MPTTQNTVKGMLNMPSLISPSPNKSPKDSKYHSQKNNTGEVLKERVNLIGKDCLIPIIPCT